MAAEVSQASFRPNLVVGGDTLRPWQEDGWVGEVGRGRGVSATDPYPCLQVRVGEAVLSYNKDCTRCSGTQVTSPTRDT